MLPADTLLHDCLPPNAATCLPPTAATEPTREFAQDTVAISDPPFAKTKMNNWVIPTVIRKPLVDDGKNIHESSLGVPIERAMPYLLDPHFGGAAFTSRDPPQLYGRRVEQLKRTTALFPTDSLAFGGYPGVDFLQRNTKQT